MARALLMKMPDEERRGKWVAVQEGSPHYQDVSTSKLTSHLAAVGVCNTLICLDGRARVATAVPQAGTEKEGGARALRTRFQQALIKTNADKGIFLTR